MAALPLGTARTIANAPKLPPWIKRLMLGAVVLVPHEPVGRSDDDHFEAWLIERWRKEIAGPAFRESAEHEFLRAQWEREG